jgi:hypothetical protein
MPPAIDFYYGRELNAAHSVLGFGGQSLPTPDLAISTVYHCIHCIHPTLGAPTMALISITGEHRMQCIQSSVSGVKIPAQPQSLHPGPLPLHSLCIPHPRYSHHAPRHRYPSQVSTECITFGFRFLGLKSPPPPDLACLLVCLLNACSYYLKYITYSTLITPPALRYTSLHPGQILYIFL